MFLAGAGLATGAEAPRTKIECVLSERSVDRYLLVTETNDRLEFVVDDLKHGGIARTLGVKIAEGVTPRRVGFSFAKKLCSWLDGPRPVALCAAADGDIVFYGGENVDLRKEVGRTQARLKLYMEQVTIDSVRPVELQSSLEDAKTPMRREDIRVNAFIQFGAGGLTQAGTEMFLDSCTQPIPSGGMPPMPKVTGDSLPYIGARPAVGSTLAPGALLLDVSRGGPAAEAGIKNWDVVCALDGQPIATTQDFLDAVHRKRPGDRVAVELSHRGQPKTTSLKIGDLVVDIASRCEAGDGDA